MAVTLSGAASSPKSSLSNRCPWVTTTSFLRTCASFLDLGNNSILCQWLIWCASAIQGLSKEIMKIVALFGFAKRLSDLIN